MIRARDVALILIGLLIASVFTSASIGAERRSAGSPALQVATAKGDVIALYAEREPRCVRSRRRGRPDGGGE